MTREKVKIKIVVSRMRFSLFDSRITDLRDVRGGVDIFATEITKARLGSGQDLFFQVTPSFLKRYEVQKVLEHKVDIAEIIYWHLHD